MKRPKGIDAGGHNSAGVREYEPGSWRKLIITRADVEADMRRLKCKDVAAYSLKLLGAKC